MSEKGLVERIGDHYQRRGLSNLILRPYAWYLASGVCTNFRKPYDRAAEGIMERVQGDGSSLETILHQGAIVPKVVEFGRDLLAVPLYIAEFPLYVARVAANIAADFPSLIGWYGSETWRGAVRDLGETAKNYSLFTIDDSSRIIAPMLDMFGMDPNLAQRTAEEAGRYGFNPFYGLAGIALLALTSKSMTRRAKKALADGDDEIKVLPPKEVKDYAAGL